jgi:hypothetical protein
MGWKQVALGAGVGYVLGARAGEKRFEQIQGWWQELTGSPAVQRVKEQAVGGAQQLVARSRFGGGEDEGEGDVSDEEPMDDAGSAEDEGDWDDEEQDQGRPMSRGDDEEEDSVLSRVGRFLAEARERGRIA